MRKIIELGKVIKWSHVFDEAGLNANTMRSAMHHRRELKREEAVAILQVLSSSGIQLTKDPEPELFSS